MSDPEDGSDERPDPGWSRPSPPSTSFSLVRPYVGPAAELQPEEPQISGPLPPYDRPTELIRTPQRVLADHVIRVIPSHEGPISGRAKATLIVAAAVVLAGSATGVYAAMRASSSPSTYNAGIPAVLPAIPTGDVSASPSVTPSPRADRTTKAPGGPAPTRSTATPGSSATGAALLGKPSPSVSATPPPAPPAPAVNLAAGRPVYCSGFTDSYRPQNAVDGNPNSYWQSSSLEGSRHARWQWLTVDLGSSTSISRIVLALPPQSVWNTRTQTIAIYGSNSGGRFSTVVGTAQYTFDPSRGNAVTISFSAVTTRYVQLTFSANSVIPAGQVSEIEIFAA